MHSLPRVPRLGPARAAVWACVAATALLGARAPAEPPPLAVAAFSDGCALAPSGAAPPCPCGEWPARLRRVLGVPLSLDRASVADLELLPGIGPVRARAVVEERARRSGFGAVEELSSVPGIGPATVARLRPELFAGDADPACDR